MFIGTMIFCLVMKRLTLRLTYICVILLSLLSCENNNISELRKIDLGKSVSDKANSRKAVVMDVADVEPIIIDDSITVGTLRIAGVDENNMVIYDRERIMIFDRNGYLQSIVAKKGNGPQEYVNILSVYADMDSRQLYVTDTQKRNVLRYTFEGEYIDVFHDESCGHVGGFPGGNLIMCYSPYSDSRFCFGIFDKKWNLLRESTLRKTEIDSRMLAFDGTGLFNGECFFKKCFEDTLYSVTNNVDRPVLIIDKGKYKAPDEYYKTYRPQGKYILGEAFSMADEYLFLEFGFDGKMYRDVWNSEDCTLLFRSEISSEDDHPGFPVNVEGETVYCWPDYVNGDNLYCVLIYEEAKKIFPDLSEDSNPVIIHLSL